MYIFFTRTTSVLRYEISSFGDSVGRERRGRSNVSIGVLLRDGRVSLGNTVAWSSYWDTVLRGCGRANRQPRSHQKVLGSLDGTLIVRCLRVRRPICKQTLCSRWSIRWEQWLRNVLKSRDSCWFRSTCRWSKGSVRQCRWNATGDTMFIRKLFWVRRITIGPSRIPISSSLARTLSKVYKSSIEHVCALVSQT